MHMRPIVGIIASIRENMGPTIPRVTWYVKAVCGPVTACFMAKATAMLLAALAYTLHLIAFPAHWAVPQDSSAAFIRPGYATMGRNGTAAVILAQWMPNGHSQYPAQRLLIVRADGTRTFLHAFAASKLQPFRLHQDLADCVRDTRNCAQFSTVALARDGTPFVTLAEAFSGAYSATLKAALVWNGSWHVVPGAKPFDHVGKPEPPTNVKIGAASSALNFAYNGDYVDSFTGEDLNDAARDRYYQRDIAAVQFGALKIQLGLGDATAMRGQFIGGYDASVQRIVDNSSETLTYAVLWRCPGGASCTRSPLGPGVVYGVDSQGDAVGDDERYFRQVIGDFAVLGGPMLWRNGRPVLLSPGTKGAAYAISEDGTIVGTVGDRGEDASYVGATRGFIANVHDLQPRAHTLDPLVVNLGARHVIAAIGVADDGRILALIAPAGERYPQEHPQLAILVPVAR